MLKNATLLIAALAAGFLAAVMWPRAADMLRARFVAVGTSRPAAPPAESPPAAEEGPALVKLTEEQIAKAGIRTAPAAGGQLSRHLHVPGTIVPSANNTARIAVKTTGIIAELRKKLGDRVTRGEVVALLDSREIADAKSEYLAARVSAELQKTLSERDQTLWQQRIVPEQQYLRSRASYEDLKVKVEAARRKLTFLGLGAQEIEALPRQPEAQFERQEIRSPMTGRIVDRRVDLGAAVGRDNLETEIYSVVNLAQVWVELAVTPGDLPLVHEGQEVTVTAQATGNRNSGRIVFIGPVLDQATRAARVVAELPNPDEAWRPGSFVAATIEIAEEDAKLLVPAEAIQTIDGKPTVFVRVAEGFAVRVVRTGRADDRNVEVVEGLAAGENVAVANSFILKAELGKAKAED